MSPGIVDWLGGEEIEALSTSDGGRELFESPFFFPFAPLPSAEEGALEVEGVWDFLEPPLPPFPLAGALLGARLTDGKADG